MDPIKKFPPPKPVKVEVDIDEVPNLATETTTLPQLEAWNKDIVTSLSECTSSKDVKTFLGILKRYSKFLKKDYTKSWDRIIFIKSIQRHVMAMADYFSAHTENVKYEFEYVFYITKIIGLYCTLELDAHRNALSQVTSKCDFVINVTNRLLGLMFVSLRFTSGRVSDVLLRVEYSRTNKFHSAVMTRLYHHCLFALPIETSSYSGFYSYYLNFQDMQELTPRHLRGEQQKYLLQCFGKTQDEVKDDLILKKIVESPSSSTVKTVEHIVFPRKRTTRAYFKYLQNTQSCHIPTDKNISDMMESMGIGTDADKSLNFQNTFNFSDSFISSSESESESDRENIICEIDSDCEITYVKKQPPKRKERHKKKKREEHKRPNFSSNEVIVLDSSDEDDVVPVAPISASIFGDDNYTHSSFNQIEYAAITGDFNGPEFHHGLITPPRERCGLFDDTPITRDDEECEHGIFENYNDKDAFESHETASMVSIEGHIEAEETISEEIHREVEDEIVFRRGDKILSDVEMSEEGTQDYLNDNVVVNNEEVNRDINQNINEVENNLNNIEINEKVLPKNIEVQTENESTQYDKGEPQIENESPIRNNDHNGVFNKESEQVVENSNKNLTEIIHTEPTFSRKVEKVINHEPVKVAEDSVSLYSDNVSHISISVDGSISGDSNKNLSEIIHTEPSFPRKVEKVIDHKAVKVTEDSVSLYSDNVSHISISVDESVSGDTTSLNESLQECVAENSHENAINTNGNDAISLNNDLIDHNHEDGTDTLHESIDNLNDGFDENVHNMGELNENGHDMDELNENSQDMGELNENSHDMGELNENSQDTDEINENPHDMGDLNENTPDLDELNENANNSLSESFTATETEVTNANEVGNEYNETVPRVLYTSNVEEFRQFETKTISENLVFSENEFETFMSGPVEINQLSDQYYSENDLPADDLFALAKNPYGTPLMDIPILPPPPKSNLKKPEAVSTAFPKVTKKVVFSDDVRDRVFDQMVHILDSKRPESPTPSPVFEKWQKRYTGEFKQVLNDINSGLVPFNEPLLPSHNYHTLQFEVVNGVKCYVSRTDPKVFAPAAVKLDVLTPAELRRYNVWVPLEHNTRTTCLLKKCTFKSTDYSSEDHAAFQQSGVHYGAPSGHHFAQRPMNGLNSRLNGEIHRQAFHSLFKGSLKRKLEEPLIMNELHRKKKTFLARAKR